MCIESFVEVRDNFPESVISFHLYIGRSFVIYLHGS